MPINKTKYRFTTPNIYAYASDRMGVYGLYDPISIVIYYGASDTSIKVRLQRHLSGMEGKCTQGVTYFNFEKHFKPIQREKELLEEHKRLYDRLPKCNEVV